MLKTLARSIRQYKRESLLAPLFMSLEVAMEVLIPFLMASLIDQGITAGNMDHIVFMSVTLGCMALLSLTFGALSGAFASRASAGFAANLRSDIFRKVQTFSFSNIDKFSPSGLITRVTTDTNNIMMAYAAIIRMAVRALLMVSFALTMAFQINPNIALIFVCVIPVLITGLFLIIIFVHPIFVRAFGRYDTLNNVVGENLRGIRVVKSFVREKNEITKFEGASTDIFRDFTKAQKRVAFNMPFLQLCIYTCTILISWFGARLIVTDAMTTGELMSVISYSMQILMSLMMMSFVFVMIVISRTSAHRVMEVLKEEPGLKNPESPVNTVSDGAISFRDVDFSYVGDKDRLCLSSINVDIRAGETIGIIGGTGSSKTTFVQLIPRLYDVIGGSVRVGGLDVREYDMEALRNEVAVVLQKNTLFAGTVSENLRWGNADASDEELRRVCALAQADGFIGALEGGYDANVEQDGTNLSGGQKQRLCIARALLKKPKILILDDSTSAVDIRTDALIRKAFREELPETTKLIIAQRISSVQDADRIIVMDGGRINAVGTHEELLASNPIYKEVHGSQIQGGGDFDEAG